MKHIAKKVYMKAGFSEEHATQLANLFEVVAEVNQDLRREGKKDLLTQLREKRSKEAMRSQEPTGMKAAIYSALILMLLTVIGYTVACSI